MPDRTQDLLETVPAWRVIPTRVLDLHHKRERSDCSRQDAAVYNGYAGLAAPLLARAILAVLHHCDDQAPGAQSIRRSGDKVRTEFAHEIGCLIRNELNAFAESDKS